MVDRNHILTSAAMVMVCLAIVVTATGTIVLYRSAIAEKRSELLSLAWREAKVIEATFRHNMCDHSPADHPSRAAMRSCPKCSQKMNSVIAVMSEIGNLRAGWGEGVEFVIGQRDGDSIQFLLPSKHMRESGDGRPTNVSWSCEQAEPVRLALTGRSGIIEAEDYRGDLVLAGYAPVEMLGWGVVAKIDMAQLRRPFVAAVAKCLGLAALAIIVGLVVLKKRLNPLIQLSQESEAKALHALAELKSQKYAIDEHSIVSITDLLGKITYTNERFCQISQYAQEELIGEDHRIVNSGHHPRSFFDDLWSTIAEGRIWQGEICNKAKDGSLYWVEATIAPFKDEAGQITQYVAIQNNITERKRQHVELIKAKNSAEVASIAKSAFLATMSHEIRTPMTAILGFTETMLDSEQSDSERLNAVYTVRRNGEHLLQIINDILDIAKIEAGKLEVECIRFSPVQLVTEVGALMQVRANAKGLPLNIEYVGSVPETIESDPTRLKQILVNLIGNAIKFTEAGSVRLITRFVDEAEDDRGGSAKQPRMQFDVLDTGLGMTEMQITKLFQAFSQAEASTTRRFGGTGLGLNISKRLVEMLGGCIVVESKPGEGSLFRVTVTTGSLDGVKMLDDPASIKIVQPATGLVTKRDTIKLDCHILLAEDGPDSQRLIVYVLERAGAKVTVVGNGRLAVDAALEAHTGGEGFDVILMDMEMPVLDGYEATGLLRSKGYSGPIIALTAHAMEGCRKECIQAGCDEYATKPIDGRKLIEVIQEQVQRGPNLGDE